MGELFKDVLGSDESIFLNPQFLDFDYQPKLVLHRESNQQYIASCIKPILQKRNGKNLIIFGIPGVGKTVCLKHVLNELKEDFSDEVNRLYVNCWKRNTPFKIIMDICEQINYKWTHNKNFDELMKSAAEFLNQKSVVIVLDEADRIDDDSIIYQLLEDIYLKSIILITNESDLITKLDSRIKSRLAPDTLEFKPYTNNETEDILNQRLEYCFVKNSFDIEGLKLIANKTFEMCDMRVGLFLMKEAGELAEAKSSKKVTKDDVLFAISKMQDFKTQKVDNIENTDSILISILKENSGKNSTEIYEIYKEKENKSYRTFQRKIKDLEKLSLVKLSEINKGTETGRQTIIEYNKDFKTLNEF